MAQTVASRMSGADKTARIPGTMKSMVHLTGTVRPFLKSGQ